jgi:TolB-like protein/tetratricopeptide (TPR) repeat protein
VSLEPGGRLGGYEVLGRLGAGGMGEVYRARDPRLDREVAIKILPRRFMEDAEYLARFEREARMLAALNHPHIATIHGLEDIEPSPGSGQSTVRAIVLELVEGETLAERIARGRVPIGEALAIARQIAEALDAAHVKGIVHRDLKPANVKLTPGGVVKVLDFGLAKLTGGPDDRDASKQATMLAGTKAGVILGTTAYMSPEQARGQPVDKRTDIWSFGCVLFELLTASSAFHGGTMTDTLAAIVDREPAWDRLPAATPAGVRRLLQRCLEKDASRRLRDIGDVRAELEEPRVGAARRTVWPWVAAAAALAAVVVVALVVSRGVFNRSTEATALPPIRSVAVLPLADLSARSDESYFSSGMTDELIGALAKIRAWRVISRTSVMQYKDTSKALPVIAKELGVDALVEGTVQRVNDRVRITVRLVRAGREEENLWTQSYDRDVRDVLDVQADVARSIASQVKLTLTPVEQERLAARHPVDPNVFNLYLKGRALADQGTEDAIVKGIAYLEQALQTDPKYAPAHAAMALAYGSLTPDYRAPKDVMPKSREHAVRAIELDDTLSEAHTALARVMFFYDWDWAGAENEIRHAIDLNTSSADAHDLYGSYLTAVEQHAKAIAELKLARELNPSALTTYSSLLATYMFARQYDSAIEESRRALAAYPNFAFAYAWLGMAYAMKGQFAEALPALTRARELDDNVTTTHFLAIAQAAAGNKAEATRLVKLLEVAAENRYTCAYEVATVHLHLGDRETAMQWIRRGMEEQCDCMVWLKAEPWMDPLRVDPRYADLVKRIGFP